MKFPIQIQYDTIYSGAACIKMITDYYGQTLSFEEIKQKITRAEKSVSISVIAQVFDELGYKLIGVRATIERLEGAIALPCLILWEQKYIVILYKVSRNKSTTIFHIADPVIGHVEYIKYEFIQHWHTTKFGNEDKGTVLVIHE